jgi:hypothetical protein
VVLNAPVNIVLSYVQIARAWRGQARPQHLYWLSTAGSETRVTRTAANELELSQEQGFLLRPEDLHYRADVRSLDARSERAGMSIELAEKLPDGRPKRVRFRFEQPLEAASYDFRVFRAGELVSWQPSAPGQSVSLPRTELLPLLLTEALR